ncbi:MAG TPA: guanylate kinase [Bacteroidales bacterium]|jgi:guanylate kinase|nr:guanylate kinase [Bacteroidales bacterium]HRT84559.1 guanylate kinase [Bacteroidales bacterium]
MKKENRAMIFSAPSGAGKSTIVSHLMKKFPVLGFSISATSRQPRENEVNGREYYFLSTEEFRKKIANNEFVEYEEVYKGYYYGTLKSEVERLWNEGKVIVFDIDVKGGLNLKKLYGDAALAVFIKPPSIEVLRERLVKRGSEDSASLERRIKKAEYELTFESQFDKVLVNDSLEQCLKEAEQITEEFLS